MLILLFYCNFPNSKTIYHEISSHKYTFYYNNISFNNIVEHDKAYYFK